MKTPRPASRRTDRRRPSHVVSGSGDRALIQRQLALTPEQRLQGLAQAAAFFRSARRV